MSHRKFERESFFSILAKFHEERRPGSCLEGLGASGHQYN